MVERNMFNKPQFAFQGKNNNKIKTLDQFITVFFYIHDDILLEM